MGLDFSNISLMTNAEVIKTCHNNTAIAPTLLTYVSFLAIGLFVGFVFAGKSKGKVVMIFAVAALFSGAIMTFLLLSPNTTQDVLNFFQGWF